MDAQISQKLKELQSLQTAIQELQETATSRLAELAAALEQKRAAIDDQFKQAFAVGDLDKMREKKAAGATVDANALLWKAAEKGNIPMMELAREWGATNFRRALIEAAEFGHLAAMRVCHDWGAKNGHTVDGALLDGHTADIALYWAAGGGHVGAALLARLWGAEGLESAARRADERGRVALAALIRSWM